MKQHLVKTGKKKSLHYDKDSNLHRKVESLYKRLENTYGEKELQRRANVLQAGNLLGSGNIEDQVLALHKILHTDPSLEILPGDDLAAALDRLEELVVEDCARKTVEEALQKRIQERVEERYNDYIREIEVQILKETNGSPENAQTLKKYGQLEKLERTRLGCSALEYLRPASLEEIVGQEQAVSSLIAKLNTPYPQHILLYGPPGVGKTTCARLALEMVRGKKGNPFHDAAPFVEVDGCTLRWDPREATNPLLGSVHDPIYQGARRELADQGIPEPKLGLVTDAHGGILFIDEFGEMDLVLQNKLLKVLEDKRVFFDSSYYDPSDDRIPRYIKQIFEQGVPADFILIAATSRIREEINPAFRSRCMEVFFQPLSPEQIREIIRRAAAKLSIEIEAGVPELISEYCSDGRGANKLLVEAYGLSLNQNKRLRKKTKVSYEHTREAIQSSRLSPQQGYRAQDGCEVGKIFGMGASGFLGAVLELEVVVFPAEKKGQGSIRFNDTAGSMTRDSVFNAASVLRKETGEKLQNYDLHINIIGGGRVDGPSAGAAIYLATLSAIQQRPIRQDVAVTGELSIQGQVRPVGALNEKILGARQAGIRKLLIPQDNMKDIPYGILGLEIQGIEHIEQAYQHIFPLNN
ncbi:MAG TPA: Lon family ATP-dependent protease [Syntrophomonadaceae bacterium]|nr:Lon family ATP-dependent protease [Syntrophomonadaceae bacterium]